MAERTLPTDGMSPCDFYDSVAPTRALGHFQWNLSGTAAPAADAMVLFDINDATTRSSGTIPGLSIQYDISGAFTGGGVSCLDVDVTTAAVVSGYGYITGLNIDLNTSGTLDLSGSRFVGERICIHNESGSTMNMIVGLMLEKYNTTAASSDFFIMMRNQGDAATTNAIGIWGTNKPTYLFAFQTAQTNGCMENGDITSGKTCIYGLRVVFQSTVGVIPVYAD